MAEVTAELECTRMVMRNLDSNDYDDEVDKNSDDDGDDTVDDDDEMLIMVVAKIWC